MLAAKREEQIYENTDQELVEQTRQGSKWAYTELVRRHRKPLLRFIFQMTRDLQLTEDIIQESLLKAYIKIHLFRGQSSFKSWLFRIGVNTAKNKFRSRKYQSVNIENIQLSIAPKVENEIYKGSLRADLKDEISKLPERQKVALSLRIFDDLSFKEIASIMKSPYDTAKANYRHALLKIRKVIHKKDIYDDWEDIESIDKNIKRIVSSVSMN